MKQYETPSVTLMTVYTELGFATSGEEKFSGSYIKKKKIMENSNLYAL